MPWNLIIWAISFILTALLAPKPKFENAKAQNLGDITFPQAGEGFPVTKVWGTVKVAAPNTLWFGAFRAVAITQRVRSGLFSHKTITTGYKYYVGMDLAICLGPGVRLLRIKAEKDVIWEGTLAVEGTITIDKPTLFGDQGGMSGNVDFYPGNFIQTASAYLDAQKGEAVPSYIGICHVVFKDFYIGNQASLKAISFEVDCFTDSLGMGVESKIGVDSNPMEILYDAMTSNFGAMMLPPTLINKPTFVACATTLFNENNGASVCMDGSNSFKEFSVEVLRQIGGIVYQDQTTGLITAKLIRKDYVFNSLPVFGDNEITDVSNISKSAWSETYNQIRLVYPSRQRDYEDTTAYAEDMANIGFQGRPKSTQVNFPLCKNDSLASFLAFRELTALAVPVYALSLVMNRAASALRPGDVIVINFVKYGIVDLVMRIQRINAGTILDNRLKVEIYQDVFSVTDAVYATTVTPGEPSPSFVPQDITTAQIFTLPFFFADQQNEVSLRYATHDLNTDYVKNELVALFAIRPDANTSNYKIYSNESLTEFGALLATDYTVPITGESVVYPPHCKLYNQITNTQGFVDGSMTILVKEFYRPIDSRSLAQTQDGGLLAFINDELMLVTTVIDNFDGTWSLSVHRGILDTRPQTHAINDQMFFFENLDPMVSNSFAVGNWVHAKPLGVFGGDITLGLSAATDFKKNIVRRRDLPIAPNYLQINNSRTINKIVSIGNSYTLTWKIRNRLSNVISIMTDISQAANANEQFEIDLFKSGVAYGTVTVAGNLDTYSFTIPSVLLGLAEIRIRAKSIVDGSYSYQTETYPVSVINGYILLSDGISHELLSGSAQVTGADAIILSE